MNEKIINWIVGITIALEAIGYGCVFVAVMLAALSFNVETNGLGWICYVIGTIYVAAAVTLGVRRSIKAFLYPNQNRRKQLPKNEY